MVMQSFKLPLRGFFLSRIATCLGVLVVLSSTWAGTFEVGPRSELKVTKNRIRASQFLHRATFGPTVEEIDALADRMRQVGVRRACEEWIDDQFNLSPTMHEATIMAMLADDNLTTLSEGVWVQRHRYHAWWHNALTAPDQLRQRVAWALIQILVTSEDGAGFNDLNPGDITGLGRWLGPTNYYDMLVANAFGNYRDILRDVTYHPIMGVYLSHMRNRKSNGVIFPDENYAREIMQLFSIGLYDLRLDGRLKTTLEGELIPTYDNETIKEFARVFTGLAFAHDGGTGNPFWSGNDFLREMEMNQSEHDTDPKVLLNNETIDIDEGNADIAAALDNLFAHENVAPFISYRLIQRLVKCNPSRGYVRRVARTFNDNGQNVKGDMKAVIKAILLDPEAWRSVRLRTLRNPNRVVVMPRGSEYSRLREPVIRYTSLLRAVHVTSDYPTGRMMVTPLDGLWLQEPYKSPSVFNFFLPDFQPPGDLIGFQPSRRIPNGVLVAPEFQQKTAVTSNELMQRYISDIANQRARFYFNGTQCNLNFDLTAETALAADDATMPDLLDLLDLVFCSGTIPQEFKDRIVEVIIAETTDPDERVENALIAVATSPYCAVSE